MPAKLTVFLLRFGHFLLSCETFAFKETGQGPAGRSFDLFGDGSVEMIQLPGHTSGLAAVKISHGGKFVLLFSDGGYAEKSWQEMIPPGTALDEKKVYQSLQWIRKMSQKEECLESLANHDIFPHSVSVPRFQAVIQGKNIRSPPRNRGRQTFAKTPGTAEEILPSAVCQPVDITGLINIQEILLPCSSLLPAPMGFSLCFNFSKWSDDVNAKELLHTVQQLLGFFFISLLPTQPFGNGLVVEV